MKKLNLKKLNLQKSIICHVTSARVKGGLPATLQTTARPSELVRMCNLV